MAVARELGHVCEGLDLTEDLLSPIEQRVYGELQDLLHTAPARSRLQVQRFVPLPCRNEQYDLITSFLVCFNRHNRADEWGTDEWRFFIEDAMRCLRPGGRLFLRLNANRKRFGNLCYYDEPTLSYFRSVGSVDDGRVLVCKSS